VPTELLKVGTITIEYSESITTKLQGENDNSSCSINGESGDAELLGNEAM
jgi:hypothetical protein